MEESSLIQSQLEDKHDSLIMMSNFCEQSYVYAEMTATEGEHIDNNNHSQFKPEYPVTIYATYRRIDGEKPLVMTGELVEGTTIDLYLASVDGEGDIEFVADGQVLYSEHLYNGRYNVGSMLSGYYPYAQSDKKIQVQLPADVETLEIRSDGFAVEWCGMDVILPEEYATPRWWYTSSYDAFLQGVEQVRPYLKDTSTIMISPSPEMGAGRHITINPDVTYTTEVISSQANEQTIQEWTQRVSAFAPHSVVRFENVCFTLGTTVESAAAYYGDMLAAFKEYGLGWYSNDYRTISSGGLEYANGNATPYKDGVLEVEILKVLQNGQ
jgi:hypothetical protein